MFCPKCGNALAPGATLCSNCGLDQTASTTQPPAAPASAYDRLTPPSAPTSGKAIGSLVCGLLFIFLPAALAAVVLGHLALSEIKKNAGRIKGHSMAITGLVLGYMGVVLLIPIVLIIAAIAIPNLLRARIAANEATAAATVRLLVTAEVTLQVDRPQQGYSCELPVVVGYADLDPEVANGTRHGYVFEIRDCASETSGGPVTRFHIVAHPVKENQSGIRAFCADESGVIKVDPSGSAQACIANGAMLQ